MEKTFRPLLLLSAPALGRTDGGNIRIDVRWAGGEVDRIQRLAKELVDLQPQVALGLRGPARDPRYTDRSSAIYLNAIKRLLQEDGHAARGTL
jgi:hypothetical protein